MGALIALMPLIIELIRLGKDVALKVRDARQNYDELHAFILVLQQEGREPTPEELFRFTGRAIEADEGVQSALRRMREAAAAQAQNQAESGQQGPTGMGNLFGSKGRGE